MCSTRRRGLNPEDTTELMPQVTIGEELHCHARQVRVHSWGALSGTMYLCLEVCFLGQEPDF